MLGPNTIEALDWIAAHLGRHGYDPEVRAVDSADGVDLLWACGLLTAELVAAGVDLDVRAAPIFAGETDAVYRSVIIARRGAAPPRRRLAVNEYGSWSGYRALFHDAVARSTDRWHPNGMDEVVVTGAHVDSVAAVAHGRADVAAIDHSVWDWLVATDASAVENLVVVDQTVDTPAPPFSLGSAVPSEERMSLVDALSSFPGPPTIRPTTIEPYLFMVTER